MTPKEIAEHLLTSTALDFDALAPLREYAREKAATGAPTEIETEIMGAAHEVGTAARRLHKFLEDAKREAVEACAIMSTRGATADFHTWFMLGGNRENAYTLSEALRAKRDALRSLLTVWIAVADRIVATDADRAAYAAQKREQAIASLLPSRMLD